MLVLTVCHSATVSQRVVPDARVDVLYVSDVSDVMDTTDVPETMDEAVIIISSESDVEQAPPRTSKTKVFTPTKFPPSSSSPSESRLVFSR